MYIYIYTRNIIYIYLQPNPIFPTIRYKQMFTYMRKNTFICLNFQKCKHESIWIITFTIMKASTCHRFMLTECYSTNVSKGLPAKGTRGASCINHDWFSRQIASACLRSAVSKKQCWGASCSPDKKQLLTPMFWLGMVWATYITDVKTEEAVACFYQISNTGNHTLRSDLYIFERSLWVFKWK